MFSLSPTLQPGLLFCLLSGAAFLAAAQPASPIDPQHPVIRSVDACTADLRSLLIDSAQCSLLGKSCSSRCKEKVAEEVDNGVPQACYEAVAKVWVRAGGTRHDFDVLARECGLTVSDGTALCTQVLEYIFANGTDSDCAAATTTACPETCRRQIGRAAAMGITPSCFSIIADIYAEDHYGPKEDFDAIAAQCGLRISGAPALIGGWAFKTAFCIALATGLQRPPRSRRLVAVATWDPDGLLPAHGGGGHFARREREKAAQLASSQLQNEAESLLAAALGQTRPLQALPQEWQQQGGIAASQIPAAARQALAEQLRLHFMPVNLDYPGLRVQHLDPPVFTVEDFFSSEQCDELVDAARESVASVLQERGLRLFGAGEGREWGTPGRLPVPQQYAYEGLQVTNLNNVPEGGATRFNQLDLAVRPRKGMALLFFPSFADGTPDARTLHTAEGAVDDKWVTQQWVARGLAAAPAPAGSRPSGALAAAAGAVKQPAGNETEEQIVASDVLVARKSKTGGKGRKAAPVGKGFGSK
ncbi:hypothetical protein N2152v2_010145 [Parachlorella kessleri]